MDLLKTAKWSAVTFTLLIMFSTFCSAAIIHKYQGEFDLPIPKSDSDYPDISKGWMDDAVIEMPDHLIIYDLDVGINLRHTNVIDIQIFLQSPSKTKICLNMFDVYNLDKFPRDENYKDYTGTIFDDEAEGPVTESEAPFTGRFRPIKPYHLSKFDGEDAYGTWRLQIYDFWPADTGTLDSFELYITTPEPRSAMLFILCALGIIILKPKHSR